jgi:hypothetical protein
MTKYQQMRQFFSDFVQGPNLEALLGAIAEQLQKSDDLSIAVTDQLTISTASGVYLDKRLSGVGITRPSELGMEDLAFRKMGIQINQAKQITEALHTVLATFYGDETVRAFATSGIAGPYSFASGDDLSFMLESGEIITLTLIGDEFENPQNATTEEIVDVITRFIRSFGSDGYAQVYLDVDTGLKYVRIFGGAKGPYSLVQITGGRLQSKLEFADMRGTFLPSNTTVWEITRNIGSTHRFRWVSGPQPLLDKVITGDKLLLYGPQFESVGFIGTYEVTGVRPPQPSPTADSGYFEIQIEGTTPLASSAPDILPPPNTISITYSITVTQNEYDDLKFFLPKKNTPYSQRRYALAWEPADSLLKIYMPATTKVVKRDLIGSAHVHLLYGSQEFNGAWGSATDDDFKIIITGDYGFRYRQNGYDCLGNGGTVTIGITSVDIDYIWRENGFTHIITKTPHGLIGVVDSYGQLLSSQIIGVSVTGLLQDDPVNHFNGPYVVDPSKNYTLTSQYVTLREKIIGGEKKSTLLVQGTLPNEAGTLLFALNRDTEESPVRYLAAQSSVSVTPINIATISQIGTTVTVTTVAPHGVIANQGALITGTVNFNGVWSVSTVPSATVFTFQKSPAQTLFESVGQAAPVVNGAVTTLILDASYSFKNTHEVGIDVTLLSDTKVYEPAPDGSDYSFYATGTALGRVFAEELMRQITALGINLEIVIIYPSDNGLGGEGDSTNPSFPPISDAIYVWGGD